MIRSLSTALSVAFLGVLLLCLGLTRVATERMERLYVEPVFQTMDRIQLEDARAALQRGSAPELRAYLDRLDKDFGGRHRLLDGHGRDLVDGASYAGLLPPAPLTHARTLRNGAFALAQRSDDGRFWFVATKQLPSTASGFYGFYLLIVGVVVALGVFATTYIVVPLRKMARVVERLGAGELGARLRMTRKDEIGALAAAYDTMAFRLQASFQRERQLLQDVSHELRAPLTRLRFSTKLARSAEDREAALDEVTRDLDRLTVLVSELTELSVGPPSVDSAARGAPIDLHALVLDAVRSARIEAEAKGCRLLCTGSLRQIIPGEEEPLRRAVENVLRNAVRHSPHDAVVEVSLRQADGCSSITVRDHGDGVPPEFLERIFDPFFQVDPARSASAEGLGLGLCIAKRAVTMHGGSVVARNAAPGLEVVLAVPHSGRREVEHEPQPVKTGGLPAKRKI